MTPIRNIPANAAHEKLHLAIRNAIIEALKVDGLTEVECLAILGKLTGMMLAMQDQTKYASDALMRMLINNIEAGNQEFIATIFDGLNTDKPAS